MKFQEALKDLKSRKNRKYLLIGSEPYLKREFIKEAQSVLYDIPHEFYGVEDEEELLLRLSSENIFDQTGLIIVEGFEKLMKPAMGGLIENTSHLVICVVGDSKAKVSKCNFMVPVECVPYQAYGHEYPLWVLDKIRSSGYTIDEGVDDLIFSTVGSDFFSLNNEIKKVFLFKTEDKHITRKDVEEVVSHRVSNTAFDVFESLLKKDLVSSIKNFYSYVGSGGESVELVVFLLSYMEKMCRISFLLEQKTPEADIASILKIPSFLLRTKYIPLVKSLGRGSLEKNFDSLCSLDVQLRSFHGDKKLLVEYYFLNLKK